MHQRLWRRLAAGAFGVVLAAALPAFSREQGTVTAPPARPPWADKVDRIFAEWDRPDSPGCAVALYQDGKAVYQRGYGQADLEQDVAITPDTVFHAASVSKQFTAMTAALAMAQGRIGLDDDVRKYVPELPDYGKPITVRHLIHHTSGLRDISTLLRLSGKRDEEAFDNEAVVRVAARQKALNFEPGSEFLYSNTGYAVLALVVERATKTPFADFTEANIFKPLGMTATHFHSDVTRLVHRRAQAYDGKPGGGLRLSVPGSEKVGAGGLFTTVRDLLLWDQNFYDGKVGGLDLIKQLETPGRLNDGTPIKYAWGLRTGSYRGLSTVDHGGSKGGFRNYILRFRSEHFTVALLCNLRNINNTALAHRVAEAYLGARFPLPGSAEADADAEAETAAELGPAHTYRPLELSAFAGRYISDELETAYWVTVDGLTLKVRRGYARGLLTLRPGKKDEFGAAGSLLRFRRNARGEVTQIFVSEPRVRGVVLKRAGEEGPPAIGSPFGLSPVRR